MHSQVVEPSRGNQELPIWVGMPHVDLSIAFAEPSYYSPYATVCLKVRGLLFLVFAIAICLHAIDLVPAVPKRGLLAPG